MFEKLWESDPLGDTYDTINILFCYKYPFFSGAITMTFIHSSFHIYLNV